MNDTPAYDESTFDRIGTPIVLETHNIPVEASNPQTAKSHTLTDMSQDYEFFTTGVIHTITPFDRDPVAEFNRANYTNIAQELPLTIDASAPFFRGLGVCLVNGIPVNFDHRLYAICRERWELLRDFISGIAMVHAQTQFYARVNFYELSLVDPYALQHMRIVEALPMVPVTVFGVSSNKAFGYIQQQQYPHLPQLVRESPKSETQLEGQIQLAKH